MPILSKLKGVLDQAKISYEIYNHPKAITAQEIAATQHLSGKEMAKVVIVKIDGSFAMAVVLANRLVNFEKIKWELRDREASLADEDEFSPLFPECEIGAGQCPHSAISLASPCMLTPPWRSMSTFSLMREPTCRR